MHLFFTYTFLLYFIDIPQPPIAEKDVYRVKKGTNVILKCDPQASNSQITELWWQTFKSGHFSNLTNNWKYSGGNITYPNLQIQNVSSWEVRSTFVM